MILGIDLGSETKGTSQGVVFDGDTFVVLCDKGFKIKDVHDSIVTIIDEFKPEVIAIDAPLSVPKGLIQLIDGAAEADLKFLNREVDIQLKKDTGGAMPWCMISTIAFKGIYIKNLVANNYKGIEVIEAYPGTFGREFGKSKTKDEKGYCDFVLKRFMDLGFTVDRVLDSHDKADGAIAAFIGYLFRSEDERLGVSVGDGERAYYCW